MITFWGNVVEEATDFPFGLVKDKFGPLRVKISDLLGDQACIWDY
jgi:hypothetical protein